MVRSLAGTGRFGFVGGQTTGPLPDYIILTDLEAFQAEVAPAGASRPLSVVVRATLTVLSDIDRRVVAVAQLRAPRRGGERRRADGGHAPSTRPWARSCATSPAGRSRSSAAARARDRLGSCLASLLTHPPGVPAGSLRNASAAENPAAPPLPGGGRDRRVRRGGRARIGAVGPGRAPLRLRARALRRTARPKQCFGSSGRDSRAKARFGRKKGHF